MFNLREFAEFVEALAFGTSGQSPTDIADRLDQFGDQLHEAASSIRRGIHNPFRSDGGMSDRCRIQVVGPDGSIKVDRETGLG